MLWFLYTQINIHEKMETILLPTQNNTCVPKCPLQYYSDTEYDVLAISSTVIGIIALVTSFITLLPHFLIPSRREWPHILLPTLFTCIFILGWHFIFPISGYRYKWRDLICNSNTQTYYTGAENKWCAFDGITTYIFAIAAVFQWGAIDIYLTLRIFRISIGSYEGLGGRKSKLNTLSQIIIVYGFIFIYILISSIIILKNNKIMGAGEGGHCFIMQGEYLDRYWIIPLIIIETLGVINSFIIFGYGWFISSNSSIAIKFIKSQWRILVFRIIFLDAAGTLTINWMVWRPKSKEIKDSIIAWLGCSVVQFGVDISNGLTIEEAKSHTSSFCKELLKVPPFRTAYWVVIIVPLAAAVFPSFFFFQRDVIACFLNIITFGRRFGDKLMSISSDSAHSSISRSKEKSRGLQSVASVDAWNVDEDF